MTPCINDWLNRKDNARETHSPLGENTHEYSDNTQEEKACELVSSTTGVNINPDYLESCHHLPSMGNNKVIVKFSRRKDGESVLRNRKKLKSFILIALTLSLCQ